MMTADVTDNTLNSEPLLLAHDGSHQRQPAEATECTGANPPQCVSPDLALWLRVKAPRP